MGTFFRTEELCRNFSGVHAVNHVNFTIRENELKALIGPNGAGKTTLINVITGHTPASSGKIIYRDEEITNKRPDTLVKKGISRTFQISSVFLGFSVFDNIRLVKQAYLGGSFRIFSSRESLREVNEEVWKILERLGLKENAYTQAKNLSYGDLRVLELAITLSSNPKVLFLDEPTTGMSSGETARTTELIRGLTNLTSVVLVEHDMDVVMSISDTITVLHHGSIIAEGTPNYIRQNELVKEAYLGKEE